MIVKFFDTSALLMNPSSIVVNNMEEKHILAYRTLKELENIKISANKDEDVKLQAREVLRTLTENPTCYQVLPDNTSVSTNQSDSIILATAQRYFLDNCDNEDNNYFVTNDLSMAQLAKFKQIQAHVIHQEPEEDKYNGYREIAVDDNTMAEFYSNLNTNYFFLHINEYLLLKDAEGNLVDTLCWTGETHRTIYFPKVESTMLGSLKPKDEYQRLALDSLYHNKITMLKGSAGTGKTLLSLSYLFNCLENHKIDRIIVFCNTVATRGSAKLGLIIG